MSFGNLLFFMEILLHVVDVFLHLDKYLNVIIENYGTWTYLILFLIVFCETGLVITPFLPGDSLLFASGAFAGSGSLNVFILLPLFILASILGDTLNYSIGRKVGPKIFNEKNIRIFKKEYLDKTEVFYEKHGAKAIIFARFMPIIRTFAPFVAGIGKMNYVRFMIYNVVGGALWGILFTLSGYFFGQIEIVEKNFSLVILVIIIISVMPGVVEYLRGRRR